MRKLTTARQVARKCRASCVTSCPDSSVRRLPQDLEGGAMPYRWPTDTDFVPWELDVLDRHCWACGRRMHICDHRFRHLHTLEGPVELICKLNHCPDPHCPGHPKTKSPE